MDQPSAMLWCRVSTSTCSAASRCRSSTRSSGPRARSNGWRAAAAARRCASASRSVGGNCRRSTSTSANGSGGAITCTGSPACG